MPRPENLTDDYAPWGGSENILFPKAIRKVRGVPASLNRTKTRAK